jgi:hypothetical protein
LPDVKEPLLPAAPDDVLELDEMWSFVQKKEQTRWVWTAMYRRTRQRVAFVTGDRSKATCLRLWKEIPEEYKHCHTFSDFWHDVNGLGVIRDKHSPFPNPMSIII